MNTKSENKEESLKSEEKLDVTPEQEKEEVLEESQEVKEDEDIVEERIYNIPLGRSRISPRKKYSPKAIRFLRGFIKRHMKVNEDSVRITNKVNEKIWSRGIEKPPRKIRVRVTKDSEGNVTVRLVEGD